MHIKLILYTTLLCLSTYVFGQTTQDTVIDFDGNIYHTVKIGKQVWMKENLKVTHFNNGDPIPKINDSIKWSALNSSAYCNYNNDSNYFDQYGNLYNWFAVVDSRNLCPTGWHVPADSEWTTLTDYLGGDSAALSKLKETGTTHWHCPNTKATKGTNETGFTALPGGYRFDNGSFYQVDTSGFWWSSTESSATSAFDRYMLCRLKRVSGYYSGKKTGFSVRCVKDN